MHSMVGMFNLRYIMVIGKRSCKWAPYRICYEERICTLSRENTVLETVLQQAQEDLCRRHVTVCTRTPVSDMVHVQHLGVVIQKWHACS